MVERWSIWNASLLRPMWNIWSPSHRTCMFGPRRHPLNGSRNFCFHAHHHIRLDTRCFPVWTRPWPLVWMNIRSVTLGVSGFSRLLFVEVSGVEGSGTQPAARAPGGLADWGCNGLTMGAKASQPPWKPMWCPDVQYIPTKRHMTKALMEREPAI